MRLSEGCDLYLKIFSAMLTILILASQKTNAVDFFFDPVSTVNQKYPAFQRQQQEIAEKIMKLPPSEQFEKLERGALARDPSILNLYLVYLTSQPTGIVEAFLKKYGKHAAIKGLELIEHSIAGNGIGFRFALPYHQHFGSRYKNFQGADPQRYNEKFQSMVKLLENKIINVGKLDPLVAMHPAARNFRALLQITPKAFLDYVITNPRSKLGLVLGNESLITFISKDSLADRMDLRIGDRLIRLNGQKIRHIDDLQYYMMKFSDRSNVFLDVERNSQILSFRGKLEGKKPDSIMYNRALLLTQTYQEAKDSGYKNSDLECMATQDETFFFSECPNQVGTIKGLHSIYKTDFAGNSERFWRFIYVNYPDGFGFHRTQLRNHVYMHYKDCPKPRDVKHISELIDRDFDTGHLKSDEHLLAIQSAKILEGDPEFFGTNLAIANLYLCNNDLEGMLRVLNKYPSFSGEQNFYSNQTNQQNGKLSNVLVQINWLRRIYASDPKFADPEKEKQLTQNLADLDATNYLERDKNIVASAALRMAKESYSGSDLEGLDFDKGSFAYLVKASQLGSERATAIRAIQTMKQDEIEAAWEFVKHATKEERELMLGKSTIALLHSEKVNIEPDELYEVVDFSFDLVQKSKEKNKVTMDKSSIYSLLLSLDLALRANQSFSSRRNQEFACDLMNEMVDEDATLDEKIIAFIVDQGNDVCSLDDKLDLMVNSLVNEGVPSGFYLKAIGIDSNEDFVKALQIVRRGLELQTNYNPARLSILAESMWKLMPDALIELEQRAEAERLKEIEEKKLLASQKRERQEALARLKRMDKEVAEIERKRIEARAQLGQERRDQARRERRQKIGNFLGDLFAVAATVYVAKEVIEAVTEDDDRAPRYDFSGTGGMSSSQLGEELLRQKEEKGISGRGRVILMPQNPVIGASKPMDFSRGYSSQRQQPASISLGTNAFVAPKFPKSQAPSCRCSCVDGRKVSLCNSAVAVAANCTGVCPVAVQKYQMPTTAVPPPGTTRCENRQVFNYQLGRYQDQVICF